LKAGVVLEDKADVCGLLRGTPRSRFCPEMTTLLPASGGSRPAMMRSREVLPEPDGPE